MKTKELKVGDRIEFRDSLAQISRGIVLSFRDPSLGALFEDRVYVRDDNGEQTYSIHITDVLYRLEPSYIKIPIEQPIPKVYKFDLVEIKRIQLELQANKYRDFSPRYAALTIECNKILLQDCFPRGLEQGKSYSVEIKEKE